MKKLIIGTTLALACGRLPAAKLCRLSISGNISINTGIGIWAVGDNCNANIGGSLADIKNAAEVSATTITTLCGANPQVGGVAVCSTASYHLGNEITGNGGDTCWCKRTYPTGGVWALSYYQPRDVGNCDYYCTVNCVLLARGIGRYGLVD